MAWLLGYLLIGFLIHFYATEIARIEASNDWRWELAAAVLWPLTTIAVVAAKVKERLAKRACG